MYLFRDVECVKDSELQVVNGLDPGEVFGTKVVEIDESVHLVDKGEVGSILLELVHTQTD